jgi:hypothetical protein
MIRARHGELMQTLSSIDDILDRLQKSGKYIEMKAQTGESDETNSSDPSYVCPCTFLAVLYKDIAYEFQLVSIKHFYNNCVKHTVDFQVFNGYVDGYSIFRGKGPIEWMDDKRTSVAPNQIVKKDFHDIFQYSSKKSNTVFVNAFIIVHHWARHDAMKGRHTDQLLWQTKHDFSPHDKFYQDQKLPDTIKELKSEDFTLTNCLKRWFYNLCEMFYGRISSKDLFYNSCDKKDVEDKIKRCKKKRTGFDDLDFKEYFRKRFEITGEMESMLRESINELNSLLTGAGNESSFPDPVYAAVGREDGTGIYEELIARARVIFKNSVLAAFPSSCFTKPTNIDRMVSRAGVIDVEPFVKLLMDEFNALCIPKKLMSIYSDMYGVIREWIVRLVDPDQRDHIRTKFIEFVGYSDQIRSDDIDSSELETFIKEKIFKIISVWRDNTLNYARNARQRHPHISFSNKMFVAHIFPLFADQVNCLLRNCEFFLENENLSGRCDSLYSMFHDSIKEALSNMNTDEIFENPDSSMRWSLKSGKMWKNMIEAYPKLISNPVKSLKERTIEDFIGRFFSIGSTEYEELTNFETRKMLLPDQYGRDSIILINYDDGVGVAAFHSLSNPTIYDSNDLKLPEKLGYRDKFKKMRMYIDIPKIYYTMRRDDWLDFKNFTHDIDDVEFVIFTH